jgi:hypothetical protein
MSRRTLTCSSLFSVTRDSMIIPRLANAVTSDTTPAAGQTRGEPVHWCYDGVSVSIDMHPRSGYVPYLRLGLVLQVDSATFRGDSSSGPDAQGAGSQSLTDGVGSSRVEDVTNPGII